MKFVTLDFETAYRSEKNKGTPGDTYSLKSMTYEEYIFDPRFKIHGVGIKVNGDPTIWHYEDIEHVLRETFLQEDCTLICHNTLFDGAILSWVFGITCKAYYCTQAMSRALWAQSSSSLDALTRRLFPNDENKRKGKELGDIDGIWELTPEQNENTGRYCIQDVDLTFDSFSEMWKYFPDKELEIMHLTLKMFIEPLLEADIPAIEAYKAQVDKEQSEHTLAVAKKDELNDVLANATQEAISFCEKGPFTEYPLKSVIEEALRAWKHAHRYALRKPRKKDTPQIQTLMAQLDTQIESLPHAFSLMAWRLVTENQKGKLSDEEMYRKVLSSNDIFAQYIHYKYAITPPRKHSPTPKNKANTTWALAKDDLEFLELQKQHPDLLYLWQARLSVSSTLERTRAQRLITHASLNRGMLAAPLNYCAAHTKRWGGTNKVNFQNFGRKSPLRRALMAPQNHQVVVADLSNIESRVLAWFANCTPLLWAYKNGKDLYSEFATDVFERPVNRKLKATNEQGQYIDKDGNVVDEDDAHKPDEIEGFIGKVCILGLGYGMGPATLQNTFAKGAMGGPQLFFSLDFCQKIVYEKYRGNYPEIKQLWDKATAVIYDMACPQLEPYAWGCLQVEYQRLRLPNGLYLTYPNLERIDHPTSNNEFHYWDGEFMKKLYGGLLVENIIQALSRIIMAEAMIEIEKEFESRGLGRVALTVHDEIIAVSPTERSQEALDLMIKLMCNAPEWCDDGTLTLDAEGGYSHCYSK